MANNKLVRGIKCRIRVPKPIEEVYAEYQPDNDKVYDAVYRKGTATYKTSGFCVIDVKDKKIVVRDGEFEFVEDSYV